MTKSAWLAIAALALLTGCTTAQFDLGPEVAAPQGCIDARARGHDC